MKLLGKVFGKEKKGIFTKADFTETKNVLINPARGWYQLFTFSLEEEPDYIKTEKCLVRQETLVLVLIDIGHAGNRDLELTEVQKIKDILKFFKERGKDIILRITYDHVGKCIEREPSFFPQVINHLKTIGPVLYEFKESIFVYQGLLVGNWGEMHTSKFLETDQLVEMTECLKSLKGEETFLAVRCPVQWRNINKKNSEDVMKQSKMGLFDDAIIGSVSDLGTFGKNSKEIIGWNNPWIREEELDFENVLCKYAPNGGEVVAGEGYYTRISHNDLIDCFKRMHLTYLNRLYDTTVLNAWKNEYFNGESLYEYIGAHLGYRFHIKNAKVIPSAGVNAETATNLEIEIDNLGFANIYQETELEITWTDIYGRTNSRVIFDDMRKWQSGQTHIVHCIIDSAEGNIYLSAKRKSDNRRIYFANISDLDGRVLLGSLS